MKRSSFLTGLIFIFTVFAASGCASYEKKQKEEIKMLFYDFTVKNNKGSDISLTEYKGKVLLVVNTATQCGLTSQYEQLQALYEKYKGRGFEILDFPSNQFLGQAPGTDEEINDFCALNYGTTFPRFAKVDVNGNAAAPLFVWLKKQAPRDTVNQESGDFEKKVAKYADTSDESAIKWNFGKFLIDRNGNVAGRYSPVYKPSELEKEIEKLLN